MITAPGGSRHLMEGTTMTKTTPDSIERELKASIDGFQGRARAVKDAHRAAQKELLDDTRLSDAARRDDLAALDKQTRSKLDAIKAEQESYVRGLRNRLDSELRGNQPTDVNSVLLRRDAADRARRISDEREALDVLSDAARSGDESLAHAVGYRARQSGWTDVLDSYQRVQPEGADTATALAVVEGLDRDPGYNLSNQIAYAAPIAD